MNLEQERMLTLDACIKCSACSAQCPVAAVYPPFPGPKSVGPDMERLRLEGVRLDPQVLAYCSNCKTCEVTCPSGVKITAMILGARQDALRKEKSLASKRKRQSESYAQHRVRDVLLGHAEYLGRAGTLWPKGTNGLLGIPFMRRFLEKSLGISRFAPIPKYQVRFKAKAQRNISPADSEFNAEQSVVYFPGCFVNYNDPQTGNAIVKVLKHQGYTVIVPPFHCCGVPLIANGHFGAAEEKAKKNLELMEPYLQAGLPVITSCTSCGLALKEDYPNVQGAAGAERIGRQSYDFFEFLWKLHELGKLKNDFKTVSRFLGYHAPCHLKAQGIGTPAVRLLKLIPGVRIVDLDAGCCGLSGSYGFKAEKYLLSQKIGSSLFRSAREGAAQGRFQSIITECSGCREQIEQGSKVKTEHPVWTLVRAYGLD